MTEQMEIMGNSVCKGKIQPNMESLNPLKQITQVKTKKDV